MRSGYFKVSLCKDGKIYQESVHRLVARHFIDNPDNLPQVNHIDENKMNNKADNLEWTSCKTNINHGTHNARSAKTRSKPVYCVELDQVFDGANEAARELGLYQGNITRCCQGSYKTTGGYHFKYAE